MIRGIWNGLDRVSLWRPTLVKISYLFFNLVAIYRFFYFTFTGNPRPPFWLVWNFNLPVIPGGPLPWAGWLFAMAIASLLELYGYRGARRGDEIDPTRFSIFWAAFFIRVGLMFARWG